MKNAELAPYKVLFCIADTKVSQQILDYLNTHKETMHYTCLAEGTRRLGILQMLGVGKIDRHLILGIIRTSTASQTLKDLDTILMPDGEKSYGWAFTTKLSSITSEVIEFINGERQASNLLEQTKLEEKQEIQPQPEEKREQQKEQEIIEENTNTTQTTQQEVV